MISPTDDQLILEGFISVTAALEAGNRPIHTVYVRDDKRDADALKLARMVVTHIIATGGVALTDDLVGQFLGQDLVRRLSHRLGEGVFNGALTARVGAAAIAVIRPLPFIEAQPIRVRDLVGEVVRLLRKGQPPVEPAPKAGRII